MNTPKLKILQADATPEEATAHIRARRIVDELKQLNNVSCSIKGIGKVLSTIVEHEGCDEPNFPLAHNDFVRDSLYKTLDILSDHIEHTTTTLQGLLNH